MRKLSALVSLALAGCLSANAHNDPITSGQDAGGGNSQGSPVGAPMCGETPHPMDPSTLPSCCTDGAAHCLPASLVPGAATSLLSTCSGGYCVPDPFIKAGGIAPPLKCVSLNNAEGRCLSVCIPQVAKYQALLPQDVCADDERCAPCVSPLDHTSTGACSIGTCGGDPSASPDGGTPEPAQCPHVGPPVIDPSTLPACGTAGDAHCVQAALVPSSLQAQLNTCPTGYCVPDTFIASGGNFIPPTCTSINGAEGRCLSTSIPKVAAQESQVPQDKCAATERCMPCYNPLDSTDTGACRLSCDPGPTKPAAPFAACCNGDAKCVPTTAIPQALQKNLSADSCMQNDLCVPTENLQASFSPPACSASGFLVGSYTGVCLSDCLSFGIQGLLLAKGDCSDNHTCAPCKNPLTGAATGAPGCPP
ncbi:MAG TPA: hypothetical protein VFF06_15855 [Polyangia bacterium]|nr:hypothetical protein [Polyangia bacterium]